MRILATDAATKPDGVASAAAHQDSLETSVSGREVIAD